MTRSCSSYPNRTAFCVGHARRVAIALLLGLLALSAPSSPAKAQVQLDERVTPLPDNPAVVTIENVLPYAHVTVNGVLLGGGVGQHEVVLPPGSYAIRVCQQGYHCADDRIDVALGERRTWRGPDSLQPVRTSPVWGVVTSVLGLGAITGGVAIFNNSGELRSDGVAVAGLGIVGVGLGLVVVGIAILSEPGPELPAEAVDEAVDIVPLPPSATLPSISASHSGLIFRFHF